MKQLRAIMIHGVGQQDADFADEARHNLRGACLARGVAPFFLSCHWAPLADGLQQAFLTSVEAKGSSGNLGQRLAVCTLADALVYQSNALLRARIQDQLDRQVACFHGQPFTVIAHSLGGLVATDWLRQRPQYQDVRLVTMGCNIGLFHLGEDFASVPQLLRPNRWVNVYHKRDVLGFPLNHDGKMPFVQDFRVSLGGWFHGWTSLSHLLYWSDRKLFAETIPKLLAL